MKKVAQLNRRTRACAAIGGVLIVFSLSFALAQRQGEKHELTFDIEHRVNAHGDEFNALAKSADGKRLFTATEKGEVIVWNLAANKLEKTLRQPTAFHLVASLADPRELVAAGSNHLKPINAVARKWNIETGEFVDLPGLDRDSMPVDLATETVSGLIALTTTQRKVLVWDARSNKLLAEWTVNGIPNSVAVLGRDVFVSTVDQEFFDTQQTAPDSAIIKLNVDQPQQAPVDFLRVQDRAWTELAASPDYRLLRATYYASGDRHKTVVIDPSSKRELGIFDTESSLWINKDKLMLFEWLDPVEVVQISPNKPPTSIRKFERIESDMPGRPFGLSGQVSNADGSKAWASYRQGPGLLEFDLTTRKIKALISGPSGAYALSVRTEDGQAGHVLTGGGDGYVRLWKLPDFSLLKEYKVAPQQHYVTDALLVPGARLAVVGTMPMDATRPSSELESRKAVSLFDLETGQQRKLFDALGWRSRLTLIDDQVAYAELGSIKFAALDGGKTEREFALNSAIIRTAVSENHRWLAVVDSDKKLTVFDLTTGEKRTMPVNEDYEGPLVVTNDGGQVYSIGHEGSLTTWDIAKATTSIVQLKRIREMHSRVDFMTLANDDRWLVTAGNHRDVAIFDRNNLRLLFFTQSGGAAVYVEKIWIKGNRMISTTDTGVMYSGVIK